MNASSAFSSDLLLRDYVPYSQLRSAETQIKLPRFSLIDAHNHLGDIFDGGWCNRPISELLNVLDEADVQILVDLDGGWGEDILNRHLDHFKSAAPERFLHFGGVDWSQWPELGDKFGESAAKKLRIQVERGAQGLKIWKNFGLKVRDHTDQLVAVDDERLIPIWETAAELQIPVIIHVADPVAFFDPLDNINERWEELHAHPDWHFPNPHFPAFITIIGQLANLVARHPDTTFIGAHVGCYAENLKWVGELLDRCPNFYVDIAARLGELGRQPYTARRFFIQNADRVLFGTDLAPDPEMYRLHYRFLESDDEYFNYDLNNPPSQGRWRVYGIHLPDDVLEKVYQKNALRVLNIETV
ncbi:MAG TPA: amidohydrolase family protein [Anaerolineales bacterium]|jgi:predicted TIM-barrel fold metal-dependent hydrolase|nr:amidohydrolase family protein [Anaerolineales bacterium]